MSPDGNFTRGETQSLVDAAAASVRREFESSISTVQVQVGAAEKILSQKINTVDQKISSAKAWGIAALLGGQTLAAVVSAYIGPRHAVQTGLKVLAHFVTM